MRKNIWLYYGFSFLSNAMFWSAVLIPFFKGWGNLNQTQIQILQSWFMLSMFLMEIPTGVIADVFGKKISLILGALMPVFATLIYTSFQSFSIYFLAEFLFGLGYAFRSGADSAFIYESLKQEGRIDELKKIYQRVEALKLMGILVSALLGSALTLFFSPKDVVLLSVIPMALCFFESLFFVEPKNGGEQEVKRWQKVFKEGARDVFKSPTLRILGLDAVYIPAITYFVTWFYQVKLEAVGVPLVFFGVFSAILCLSQIGVLHFNKRIEKLFGGEKEYLVRTVLLVFVGFLSAVLIGHWLSVLILIIFSGGFGLTRRVVMLAEINKHIEDSRRSTVNSFVNMIREILIVVLNPIMGLLVDFNLNTAFLALSLLSFGGLFITMKAKEKY